MKRNAADPKPRPRRGAARRRPDPIEAPPRPGPLERITRWEVVERVRAFVGAVLRPPPRRRPGDASSARSRPPAASASSVRRRAEAARALDRARRRTLPFDIYLNLGVSSVRLFAAGPIDPFSFFQRCSVPEHHEVEFLSRLSPEAAGSEDYRPYGLVRVRGGGARELPPLPREAPFWDRLHREHGLARLPLAKTLVSKRFAAYDPRFEDRGAGFNRITPPKSGRTFQRVGKRRYSHADMLELMRREMSGLQVISWIEEAFTARPVQGQIVHRYYLDADKQVLLVRDHWKTGKALYLAETSEEAQRLCEASGLFTRPSLRRAA